MTRRAGPLIGAALLFFLIGAARAFPIHGDQTVLPTGTELGEDALELPRELFKSEVAGGSKSYLVNLGDLAFSSPSILGGVARQAGVSCATCHVHGTSNAKLYVPGMSTRPGNFDTTGPLFNPKADNGVLDPVTIPSLRGARYLAPYGHDGRFASLRDFVHNVIVNEFAGPEPSAAVLDALVVYIQDIDFLPNSILGPGGKLNPNARPAELRGEALFAKSFPRNPGMSCAGCHMPSDAFVDHRQHDVGSGGLFKTPTLLNADFNGPYFHDGRYDTYDQVVAYFDRSFDLGLSKQEQQDLVAYLTAVGDGERAYEYDGVLAEMKELNDFASVLDVAIAAHDRDIVMLVADTVGGELRDLTEQFPDRKDTSVSAGLADRNLARVGLKDLVLTLRQISNAASDGRFDDAAASRLEYRKLSAAAVPALLLKAEPYSLFNPSIHMSHYDALRQMMRTASSASH